MCLVEIRVVGYVLIIFQLHSFHSILRIVDYWVCNSSSMSDEENDVEEVLWLLIYDVELDSKII